MRTITLFSNYRHSGAGRNPDDHSTSSTQETLYGNARLLALFQFTAIPSWIPACAGMTELLSSPGIKS